MATAADLHLLGIGYRMIRGGEEDFARASSKIRQSAKEAAGGVSAAEAATDSMAAHLAALASPANVARLALVGIGAAATVAGFAIHKALDEFAAFEQAMKNVKAVSGSTEEQLASLSDAALDLSRNSRFDPKQVAQGLYALASAGMDARQQLAALPGNMNYAEAAQTSLGQATETTLLALNNFNLAADQTNRVADVFTAAIGKSAFNADRLSVALRNAAPSAGTMNQSFEGTMAVLSVLVKRFNNGELAGTGFKVALAQLQAKAKDLGIQVRDTHGNMLPMADILDVLETRGIHAKDAVALFGQEAGPSLAVLMQVGSKALRQMEKDLASNGQAALTSKDQLNTLEGAQKILANSIEVFWIKLGRSLSGGQRDLTEELISLVQKATEWVVDHADQISHAWETATSIAKSALEILVNVVEFIGGSGAAFDTFKEALYAVAAAWAAVKLQTMLATAYLESYALAGVVIEGIEGVLLAIRAGWVAVKVATIEATAAMLANPYAWIAVAVGALIFSIQRYIDKTNEAWELELKRTQTGQTYALYLSELRHRTELLTEAEAEHGRQMLANLEIEARLARVAADKAQREDPAAKRSRAAQGALFGGVRDQNVPYTQETRDAVAYAQQLEQTQAQMETRLRALGGLSDETINVVASAADGAGAAFEKTEKGLQKTLDAAKLAAERAEALYAAQQQGLPVVLQVTRSFDLQDAALAGIAEGSEAAARALSGYAARVFDATRLLELLVDAQERNTDTGQKLAAAQAAVTDAVAGNNLASQAAARAAEVETFRRKFLLALDDDRVKKLRAYLDQRDRELRMYGQQAAAAARDIAFTTSRREAEAALKDARNENTEASRALAVQLEIENRIREDGAQLDIAQQNAIAAEVIGRHAVTDALADQAAQVKTLQQFYRDLDRQQAEFADSQQVRNATRALGSDLAGILQKYGLLSDATKELAIKEQARAIFNEEHGTRTREAIEAELEARQRVTDAAARGAAEVEIAQLKADQLYGTLAATFYGLADALGGTSTQIGAVAASFGDLIGSLGRLRDAGKAWSAEWTAAMAGALASVGNLLKSLDVGASGKSGGPQALGGRLEGNYAAEGSIVGLVIGAIVGYFAAGIGVAAGSQIGLALGGVIGAMISKAGDSASAALKEGGIISIGETSNQLNGAVHDALVNIFEGLNAELGKLGLQLQGMPIIDIKVRDNVIRVIVGSVIRTFSSMQDAVSFGIAEALKQAGTANNHLPEEIRQALARSTATDLQSLQADIDFAKSIAYYGVPEVVLAIDKAVGDFFVAMQRATALGIDTTKVVAMFADQLQRQKDQLLGIDRTKSPEDRLRSDVAAFNQRMELLRAEKQADLADLEFKKADLAAKLAIARAQFVVAHGQLALDEARLQVDLAVMNAEVEALHAIEGALVAVGIAIATTQGIIDSIVLISEGELNEALGRLRRQGGGGRSDDRQSLKDMLADSARQIALNNMSEYGRALAEINKKWDDAIPLAHGNKDLLDQIAAARRAETDALRKQVAEALHLKILAYERGAQDDGSPQAQLAAIQAEAQALRDEFLKTAEEQGFSAGRIAAALARITAAEKARILALTEQVIDAQNLPMEQAKDKAEALGKTLSFLRDRLADGTITADRFNEVFGQLMQQASNELLGLAQGILEKMGNDQLAAEIKAKLDEANFVLQVAQLNVLYAYYKGLGVLSAEALAILDEALGYINDPANRPTFNPADYLPNAGASGGGGADIGPTADEAQRRRQEILDQIKEWNRLGESDATVGLRDLNDTLVSVRADAVRLGVSLSDLMAAHAHAVEDFWNRALAPYESGASDNVLDRLGEINRTFDEMVSAAQLYGGDQARIEAARAAAVERFWDEALAPIRELQGRFQAGSLGGLSPEQQLQAAQARFNDLATQAMAGDASAIQALPAAVEALLEQQRAFSGTGPAYQALVATIQGVLAQILSLGGQAAGAAAGGPAAASYAAGGANVLPFVLPSASARPGDVRPAPLPAGGNLVPFGPLPVPDEARVDRLVEAMEEDEQGRRSDRRALADLRTEVDRLVRTNREQADRIDDLLVAVRNLTGLVESQERRAAQGGSR